MFATRTDMKLFSNTRARRNTAFMVLLVLLVWLFALTSGIANACVLQAPATPAHITATAGYPALADAPAIPTGPAGGVAGHNGDLHSDNAPCLKVCDDGSRSVPKHDVTVVQPDPGPAPRVVVLWTAEAPLVAALAQRDDLLLSTQWLPLRVRYARLAL
jgi:hypothetical protein